MINFLKQSLLRQINFMITIFILLILVASFALQYSNYTQQNQFSMITNQMLEKENKVANLEYAFTQVFYQMRGYIAFQQEPMLEDIDFHRKQIDLNMKQLSNEIMNDKDREFFTELEEFYDYYFLNLFPNTIDYVKKEQMEQVHRQAQSGEVIPKIMEFQQSLKDYRIFLNVELENQFQQLSVKERNRQWTFISFLIFLLGLMLLMTRMMFVRLGRPLSYLSHVAEEISIGREMAPLQYVKREDEIGILSKAFENMLKSIQENEQDLMAQNEELIAQQEELQAQQEELNRALEYKNEKERGLKRRNQLIHSLSITLDKQELLESIIGNMAKVMNANKGIIVLLNKLNAASYGISNKGVQQFIEHMDEGILGRLKKTKQSYVIERESLTIEKAYHEGTMYSYDMVLPVYSSGDNLEAVMLFTRLGLPFTENEKVEFEGLAKEVSLSIEKVNLYEQTEDQRKTTNDILNTIREGVQLVDADGSIQQVNKTLSEIIGNPDPFLQVPLSTWIQEISEKVIDAESLMDFMLGVLDDRPGDKDYLIYEITSPERRIIKLYYEPLYREKQKFGTIFVHSDITKQYEIDQMKSEFVSTVSHELRTPLSSILGFSELLLKKNLKLERQERYITTIYQEANRLTSLINDFLDLQRMESGRQTYDKKYYDLIPIIERVLENQKINTDKHQFHLKNLSANTTVLGDRDKLYQVFENVIGNAVKYSPEGGDIRIQVREVDEDLFIDVQDEGLGIPEESIPKLFEKFYRVDNTDSRKIGGTGLGLSIVKEIMKSHEGEVSVHSRLEKGTTMTLRFPIVKNPLLDDHDGAELEVQGSIIIIEDDNNYCALLLNELKELGFHVLCYHNGEQAIREIKALKQKPEAIVLDIMLEEGTMDGWSVIMELKGNEELKTIPTFISSAVDDKERGLKLGANDYLIKPYKPDQLSKIILQTLLKKEKETGSSFYYDR